MTPVDPAIMFEAIANGEGDATLAPWLPSTHASFYEKHKENVVDLGENLTGTQNGLVVPEYMDIDSIEDLQPKKNNKTYKKKGEFPYREFSFIVLLFFDH